MDSEFIKSVDISRALGGDKEYFADKDSISASGLKKLKTSPAHFKFGEEIKDSEALLFGSAYHCFVLEPDRFEKEYYVFDDSIACDAIVAKGAAEGKEVKNVRATKAYKEWEESEMRVVGEKNVIQKPDFNRIKEMKSKLFSHPYAKMLLSNGEPEVGLKGTISTMAGDINVKLKPDYIKVGKHLVVDLKTARDASLDAFTKDAAKLNYHIQAAFYSDILSQMDNNRPYTFIFIAQEKTRPYAFNLFECSAQFISQGRYEYEMLLQLYKHCLDRNYWPGYQCFCNNRYGLLELNLPNYSIKSLDFYDYSENKVPEQLSIAV